MILSLLIMAATVIADQLTKLLVLHYLPVEGNSSVLIDGVFRFTYVQNTGVAFGLLKDARWLFMAISSVAIVALFIFLWKNCKTSKLMNVALSLIIGGGIGNMIDRIFRGFVIDFLDFCAFPSVWKYVFNVADACVCVGCALLFIYLLFVELPKEKKAKKDADGVS